jgi:hypothetical protein
MGFQSGLSALIRLGASLELDSENQGGCMTALSIGAAHNSLAGNCELEIAGKFLVYVVSIRGEQVLVSAALLDGTEEPELLLRAKDAESAWETVFKFVSALEKYAVKDLTRPIVVGPVGEPDAWIVS